MYKNILVPIVFDETHDTSASFNAALILADQGAKFAVMHVMDDIPGFALTHISLQALEATRKELETTLSDAAQALPDAETVLSKGHAGRSIVNYAAKQGIDCIVLASHIPGIENVFLGSTADWVVRHAKCAVHVIR